MNFFDLSFWWYLVVLGLALFGVRWVGLKMRIWRHDYDRVALMCLSLTLFLITSTHSFIIFFLVVVFNYIMLAISIHRGWKLRIVAAILIATDLAVLIYFKCLVLLMQSLHLFFFLPPVPHQDQIVADVLPLGISFYTFQLIAFLVDFLRSNNRTRINFVDYINYLVFFPKLFSGPIERWSSISAQMRSFRFTFDADNLDRGLKWMCLGFFIKFVLADNLAPFISVQESGNAWTILFSVYLFGLKLYFDFAGYSFMAVGLAAVLGINLILNFLAPYSSLSIQDFWRRWHVSLMSWFRDYLYFPLGGSKRNSVYLNLLIVFILSGFWHGASLNFLLWGTYHGILMVLYRLFMRGKPLNAIAGWFITFNSVMLGWLFFMETNSSRLRAKLSALSSISAYSGDNLQALIKGFSIPDLSVLLVVLGLSSLVLILESISSPVDKKLAYNWLLRPGIVHSMAFLTILCSARALTRFLYFNF